MTEQSKCCSEIKSQNFNEFLKQSLTGFAAFIIGFIIGTFIDIIFYRIYIKWDPGKENLEKLIIVVLLQILVLSAIISHQQNYGPVSGFERIIFRISLIMSQIFMVKYAMEKISNKFYNRVDLL